MKNIVRSELSTSVHTKNAQKLPILCYTSRNLVWIVEVVHVRVFVSLLDLIILLWTRFYTGDDEDDKEEEISWHPIVR